MTMNERAARRWLKVCCIMAGEERIAMSVTRLERSPNTPRQENSTPSHQNSYSFQVWESLKFTLYIHYINWQKCLAFYLYLKILESEISTMISVKSVVNHYFWLRLITQPVPGCQGYCGYHQNHTDDHLRSDCYLASLRQARVCTMHRLVARPQL